MRGKSIRGGLTAQNPRFFSPFFDFLALPAQNPKKIEEFEQWVAGYDPQVVAMHTPPLAATLSSTARGSSPEPRRSNLRCDRNDYAAERRQNDKKLRAEIRVTARKTTIFSATAPHGGKTMKNCAGNRSEGALRPQNRDISALFSIFWPYRPKTRRKMKILNNGLLGTTHKLSLGKTFRSLQSYRIQPVGRPQNPDVGQCNENS